MMTVMRAGRGGGSYAGELGPTARGGLGRDRLEQQVTWWWWPVRLESYTGAEEVPPVSCSTLHDEYCGSRTRGYSLSCP